MSRRVGFRIVSALAKLIGLWKGAEETEFNVTRTYEVFRVLQLATSRTNRPLYVLRIASCYSAKPVEVLQCACTFTPV